MHNASLLVADVAKGIVQPMAQRHPLRLLAGAVLLGGLLAWSRPWRWVLTPALFAGLLPQLIAKVMGQMPPEAWLGLLAVLAQRPVHQNAGQTRQQASAPNTVKIQNI